MKSFITPSYIFTPGASGVGTINLSSIENFNIKRLVAIININSNIIIYNVANPSAGFTTESSGVITLDYNTSAMSGTDLLQIIYDYEDAMDIIDGVHFQRMKLALGENGADEGNVNQDNPLPVQAVETDFLLHMIQKLLSITKSLQMCDREGRQRVTLDAITGGLTLAAVSTISTVTTVNTVSNITAIAGMNNEMYKNPARQTYALGIRTNLTFQ
jgi:hypothetical protein